MKFALNKIAGRVLAATALVALTACGSMSNQMADNTLSQQQRDGGWELLFDGKTTNGWKRRVHRYLP